VEVAARLGQRANLDLGLLRIVTPRIGDRGEAAEEDAAWRELEALSQRFWPSGSVDIRVRTITHLGGVDTAITEEITAMGGDAVAMSTHGHSARHHLLAGSTALGVLGQARVPVLLVRSGPPMRG
jgi:nucleotide-binding universal stress UspA family protein